MTSILYYTCDAFLILSRKVGLLDPFHIWCFLVDPYSWEWRNIFKIEGEGGLRVHAKKMIAHFVTPREYNYLETRASILAEFEVSSLFDICVTFMYHFMF